MVKVFRLHQAQLRKRRSHALPWDRRYSVIPIPSYQTNNAFGHSPNSSDIDVWAYCCDTRLPAYSNCFLCMADCCIACNLFVWFSLYQASGAHIANEPFSFFSCRNTYLTFASCKKIGRYHLSAPTVSALTSMTNAQHPSRFVMSSVRERWPWLNIERGLLHLAGYSNDVVKRYQFIETLVGVKSRSLGHRVV